jgi:hypothetical protein
LILYAILPKKAVTKSGLTTDIHHVVSRVMNIDIIITQYLKGAVSFKLKILRFPFVICSVSRLVDTASSVLTPLKAG